jgi:hypothetical protein
MISADGDREGRLDMAANKPDIGARAVSAVAGLTATFVARKLLAVAWTKVTGKEPPEKPEDPGVALGEAIVWGIATAAVVATARTLAVRAVSRGSGAAELEAAAGTRPDDD